MSKSKELKEFKKHFVEKTDIKVCDTVEDTSFYHWKRLIFNNLNCDEMSVISEYIKDTFSSPDKYTHLLPKLQSYENKLSLTIDVDIIRKFIIK
jgi:hypothetical protein